jgi:tRNA threonylcarbamoyl adenosine modification protein YeaZ
VILAIDTSAGTSVAVVDGARGTVVERSVADTMRHAEVVGRLIHECLDASGVAVNGLDGVVAGMGPGPFTGLRVGIAAARAFAFGAGTPVFSVASHDAIAYEHASTLKAAGRSLGAILVVTDARRRELACTAYDGLDGDGVPVRVDGPGLAPANAIGRQGFDRVNAQEVSAGALGTLASVMRAAGRSFVDSEPLYLRAPDVTLSTPKRVS